jgi:hypothetical protein
LSGENTIYLDNQTVKRLTMDLEVREIFNSWAEVYLMSLRFLEETGLDDDLSPEKAENLEGFLEREFSGKE